MKNLLFKLFLLVLSSASISQNVGISESLITPHASAILEIRSTNKGLLIPRIALTQTTMSSPIISPEVSLLVYNTSNVNDVTPGYYYWNGTRWVRLLNDGNVDAAWSLSGNIISGSEFIGTLNAQDFRVFTNNTERMRITSAGYVGIGTSSPTALLHVHGTVRFSNLAAPAGETTALVVDASGNVKARPLHSIAFTGYTEMDPNAWRLNGNSGTNPNSNFIGTTDNTHLIIRTNNTERMRISNNGNVGIGTTNPMQRLHVDGNIHVSGGNRTFFNRDNNYLAFGTNNSEIVRITADGKVGINAGDETGMYGNVALHVRSRNDDATLIRNIVNEQYREDQWAARMIFLKRRPSGTIQRGDNIANIMGYAWLNDSAHVVANIHIQEDTLGLPPGTNNQVAGLMNFATTDNRSPNGHRIRMTIRYNGNVGIGTYRPRHKLHIIDTHSSADGYDRGIVVEQISDDFIGPILLFKKSRGINFFQSYPEDEPHTLNSIPMNNDNIGAVTSVVSNNSSYVIAASMRFEIDGNTTAPHTIPTRIVFYNRAAGATSHSPRFIIKENGFVRIGLIDNVSNSTPWVLSTMRGNDGPSYISSGGDPNRWIGFNITTGYGPGDVKWWISRNIDDRLHIIEGTASNFVMTFLTGGQIGLTTVTSPTVGLQLPNHSTMGQVLAHTFSTYSDKRLKTEIEKLNYGLPEILSLRPVRYNHHHSLITDTGLVVLPVTENTIGFVAQEVYEVIPEAVFKPGDELYETWSMDYQKLIPVIVNAIQEQQKIIDRLNAEINELRKQNQILMEQLQNSR